MIGLLVKAALAVILFAGSLVGGLAATGRLDHEGTANIPLLRSFFPPPPATGTEPGSVGDAGASVALDASSTPAGDAGPADANAQGPGDGPRRRKTGRSLFGEDEAAGGADAEAAAGEAAAPQGIGEDPAPAPRPAAARPEPARGTPEADFAQLQGSLAGTRSPYAPGALFRFDGLPAGLTPEQVNEAWQRVQGLTAEIERRKHALDLQEQQLREINEDISRRQAALGKERVEIEQMHRDLDAKIERFREQVKLVRTDEVAALKRNAQTLASFEPAKAAELLEAQWKTEKGQDEVLKLLEFMDKDAVNSILDALPKELTNDLLKKRLRVSKEATAPGKGG